MKRQGGDPAGACAEEAPLTPRGKRVPEVKINTSVFIEDNKKGADLSMWQFGNLEVERGQKVTGYLEFPIIEEKLPVFLLNGESEGPTVLVLGGIHGCEYTSIDAALEIGRRLEPKDIKGRLAVLPIANPEGFFSRSIYVHPKDNKNLNRVFPGNPNGTEAEKLAYCINETAFKAADYLIDLHGGDMIEALVPFTIYQVTENSSLTVKSKELASLFGIEYVVGSTGQVGGSTYSSAAYDGKVAVIAEAGQQGILDPEQSKLLQDGTLNALRWAGLLDGEAKTSPVKQLSTFDWSFADVQGLWYPCVEVGQQVKTGQSLGQIKNLFGETVKEYFAGSDGVVLFLVTSLAINEKDPLIAIGN
ncbi:succinylglutamate desuccinylase [Neobacillus notoginsengisoli]|uniref:Succinylglutamate desuccinylase n=2 Tax=Neobacillus notoginsengisoli TaxID=1578198 RepID=A0A417YRW8_9BACI|nr:succinylglutamate desuccinylase [Neobacillus notoginsengisoli]